MASAEGRETTATVIKSPALVRGFSRWVAATEIKHALALAPLGAMPGSGQAIPAFEILLQHPDGRIFSCVASKEALFAWAQEEGEAVFEAVRARVFTLEQPCASFAGLVMDNRRRAPHVMGIINATPDSFSDGGVHLNPLCAIDSALAMVAAGASIIDVGGESTRPGADAVSPAEEISRVVPVIQGLAERGVCVSIDTRHAVVMEAAVRAGAAIINDVTALEGDPDSLKVAASLQVPVILMHMKGEPRTMQQAPSYHYAPLDVYATLSRRILACEEAGIPRSQIAIDVGIGFAKSVTHNTEILARLGMYHGLGCTQLLGVSRKSYIGHLSHGEPPLQRVPGSLATAVLAAGQGVQMIRVHDVPETVQALTIWRAIWHNSHDGLPSDPQNNS